MKRLTETQIRSRLKALPGWIYDRRKRAIYTDIHCKDFAAAIRLIGKIAKLAEKMNHHPDLHLTRYRRLKIVLTTHSEDGVTGRDLTLAARTSDAVRRGGISRPGKT